MNRPSARAAGALALALIGLVALVGPALGDERTIEGADALFEQKNYLEAANAYEAWLADNGVAEPEKAWHASTRRVAAFVRLNRFEDAEAAARELPGRFTGGIHEARAERFVGNTLIQLPHHGTRQGGTWRRGVRGQGIYTTRYRKDRAEAVAHLEKARELYARLEGEKLPREERIGALFDLVDAVTRFGPYDLAYWTPYYEEEDEEDGTVAERGGGEGMRFRVRAQPVKGLAADADGQPIFEPRPEAYDAALSPTQKMKWLLHEVGGLDETEEQRFAAESVYRRAMLARARYGPERLFQDWSMRQKAEGKLADLADDEALTLVGGRLAVVKLPADEDILALLTQVEQRYPKSGVADAALLAKGLYRQTREQFPAALAAYDALVERFPKSQWTAGAKAEAARIRAPEAILGPAQTQLAGRPAVVELTHRNIDSARFEARSLDFARVVADVLAAIERDDQHANPWAIQNVAGYLLDQDRWKSYASEDPVATFEADLPRREDRRYEKTEIATPLVKSGWYVLTAKGEGGGASTGFVLINDLAVVEKDTARGKLLFTADAGSGAAVADVKLEVIEYWSEWRRDDRRQHHHLVRTEAQTGADGTVEGAHRCGNGRNCRLITIARTADGRTAYTGLGWWGQFRAGSDWSGFRAFALTDRPVYRPEQDVKLKLWVRAVVRGEYMEPQGGRGLGVNVRIRDPKGQEVLNEDVPTDEHGALDLSYRLGEEPPLGLYYVQVRVNGRGAQVVGNQFRVEEYKKPELEVTVEAAEDEVKLGGEITAKIGATYHFGGPVSEGTVSYRVFREPFRFDFDEPGPWDWLYGPGYGFCRYSCSWFPWWSRWGWSPWGAAPRELVLTGEGALSADGTLEVKIDTAAAARDHADTDHRYIVEAEVRDASRRTITGGGEVLATRQALYAFLTTDRGFYKSGDTVFATVRTLAPDRSPRAATGTWRLDRVVYRGENGDEVLEEPVERHAAKTDEDGRLSFSFEALQPGQYRVTFETEDAWGEKVLGTQLVWVQGPGLEGRIYKFNDIELLTDKRTYAPGETARVLVRTARPGATMIFGDRVSNGVLLSWKTIDMTARTRVIEIPIEEGDTPNRWIEATVVRDARVHAEKRDLLVPPSKGMLDITLTTDKEVYGPGETGTIEVSATTPEGEPVSAPVTLFAFDKSVLQIQPELTPDPRGYFWGQRRGHDPRHVSSLSRQLGVAGGPIGPQHPHHFGDLPGLAGSFGPRTTTALAEAKGDGGGGAAFGDAEGAAAAGEMEADGAEMNAAPAGRAAAADKSERRREQQAGAAPPAPPGQQQQPPGGGAAPAKVRSRFADTALWVPTLVTGADGKASAKITFPENLTTWRVRGYGISAKTRVGRAQHEVLTTKDLLVRLAAPRFFVERDEVVLSAIVMNRLKTAKEAKVSLEVTDGVLAFMEGFEPTVTVTVDAGGEKRVDWRVRAVSEGTATVTVQALTDEESDAMQLQFPVIVHGSERTIAATGSLRAKDPTQAVVEKVSFTVPSELRPQQSYLQVRVSPTLAGAMLEALPYLLDYPYGCTEQTLNRFVPAVVTQQTLQRTGVDLAELSRTFARLNPQDSDHPTKRRRFGYDKLPVFSEEELAAIVADGLQRLAVMQHGDGGWGWWTNDRSSPYLTALVVDGLITAVDADVAVPDRMIGGGIAFLESWQASELAWHEGEKKQAKNDAEREKVGLRAGLAVHNLVGRVLARRGKKSDELLAVVHRQRDAIGAYGLALLALTYHDLGREDEAKAILRNLWQHVEKDAENQTAWVRTDTAGWWWWWNDQIETTACALRALVAIDPASADAPWMVKWLLANRRNGFYWRSTRDTAAVIASFADYLEVSRELDPDLTVKVSWDGGASKTVHITRENLFTFDGTFELFGDALTPGEHELTIERSGKGALYYNAYLSYFTLEEDVKAAGLEVRVDRKYFRLEPIVAQKDVKDARGADLKEDRLRYERIPLASGDTVKSGDLIEVQLLLTSKNDYDYLCFEDPKPAGCEPVALRSGARFGELCSNMELRDEKVVFFVSWLTQGTHRITYRLRAEVPGAFHTLPTRGWAMYAPEIRGTADEMRLGIADGD